MDTFDLADEFDSDPDREKDGVWEDLGNNARVLVASTESPRYREAFANIGRATRRRIDRGVLSDDEDAALMSGILAKTILLDWENLSVKGETIPYSTENAMKYLRDFPKFRRYITELASEEARFRHEEREDAAKNSSKSSSGPSETKEG